MRTAKLQLLAVVVASAGLLGLAGAGTYTVLAQDKGAKSMADPPAPPKNEPMAGNWTPEKWSDRVPTAFPNLTPLEPRPGDTPESFYDRVKAAYPRVLGGQPVTVQPADDTYRRLLKARLRQGQLELENVNSQISNGQFRSAELNTHYDCLEDMRTAAVELWAGDPNTLTPWLEELVRYAKQLERIAAARVEAGADSPNVVSAAHRQRLGIEAAVWKAQNPSAAKGGGPGR